MKVSVSLRGEDVEFLDAYARAHGKASRSAALTDAVRALRDAQLRSEYEQAVVDWEDGGDAELWERAAPDRI
jgi:metal-responsive CopG/Arc/MetJ family transcriptional regulator